MIYSILISLNIDNGDTVESPLLDTLNRLDNIIRVEMKFSFLFPNVKCPIVV